MTAFYVKHTFRKPKAKPNVLKEQGWVSRYRGPFNTKEEAEIYMQPFVDRYGKGSCFKVLELSECQRAACPSAYDPAYQFRDAKLRERLKVGLIKGLSTRSFHTS
ncbi:hypothetical protein [Vibrio phage BONAISHI]|nr:hypothetical protein [Vibrio phage BONAISHI]